MPVNYGSYQINPFQGFNQGLANIGQALKYRREMERQTLLDAENKRLRDLHTRQANLEIETTEAKNLGIIGAYSEEGKPPLTLGQAYAAQAKKEMETKEADLLAKRTNIYLGFIKDLKTSKGTAAAKTEKLRALLSKDPSPVIQEIAKTVEIEGDKVKYTRIYGANELKYPDDTFAPAGIYDVEVEETGDIKNPVRLIASKKREEKVPPAPQLKKFVKGKEVIDVDMNKPEDVKKARVQGFTEYEKPETEKAGQNWMLPNGPSVISYDGGRTYIASDSKTKPMPPTAVKVPGGATLSEIKMEEAKEQARSELSSTKGPPKLSPKEAALEGTGPYKRIASSFEAIAGGLGLDVLIGEEGFFPNVADAKQYLRSIKQMGKAALMNSSRGAIWEQQKIEELFPNPDKTFTNPRIEARKFGNLLNVLTIEKKFNNQAIMSAITPKEIEKYRTSNNEIDRLIAFISEPVNKDVTDKENALIEKYLKPIDVIKR